MNLFTRSSIIRCCSSIAFNSDYCFWFRPNCMTILCCVAIQSYPSDPTVRPTEHWTRSWLYEIWSDPSIEHPLNKQLGLRTWKNKRQSNVSNSKSRHFPRMHGRRDDDRISKSFIRIKTWCIHMIISNARVTIIRIGWKENHKEKFFVWKSDVGRSDGNAFSQSLSLANIWRMRMSSFHSEWIAIRIITIQIHVIKSNLNSLEILKLGFLASPNPE